MYPQNFIRLLEELKKFDLITREIKTPNFLKVQ